MKWGMGGRGPFRLGQVSETVRGFNNIELLIIVFSILAYSCVAMIFVRGGADLFDAIVL